MEKIIKVLIKDALKNLELSIDEANFSLERPAEMEHGDWASNVAMVVSKEVGKSPREIAEEIAKEVEKQLPDEIEKLEIAGPGFINFHLKRDFFREKVAQVLEEKEEYGKNEILASKKVMVEYTDPNIAKPLHIGHLMSNAIGESIARIISFGRADVARAVYYSDIGLNLAKAIWGMKQLGNEMPAEGDFLEEKAGFLGKAYVFASTSYEESPEIRDEIDELNVRLYKGGDEEVSNLYRIAKEWSMEHFKEIYETVGSAFDFEYFESKTAPIGEKIVQKNTGAVFEESDGALVYRGEKNGLHTRVFISSKGVPTYEAKELALPKMKYEEFPYDTSIVITADEQREYFKVVLSALFEIEPELAQKTRHVTHGMMQLTTGKMSSRKGNVITGEALLREMITRVQGIMAEREEIPSDEKEGIAKQVAVAAIKYAILKQASGKNIIYDEEKALSFEGDSGPYLQYTHARIRSLLERARSEGIIWTSDVQKVSEEVYEVEKILERFPETVERAQREYEPHYITTYLTELAGAFNSFYGQEKIVDKSDVLSPYKLMVSEAVAQVLKNGLWLLGIEAPNRM
jgi:arginyl-tRNA synthetase